MMKKGKQRILWANLLLVFTLIIVSNLILGGNLFVNILGQEEKVVYTSDEIKEKVSGYTVYGDDWSAISEDPNVTIEFGKKRIIDKVIVDMISIQEEDKAQIYYANSCEFTGNKYIEENIKDGKNVFAFGNVGEVDRLRIDLTSNEKNSFTLKCIEIKFKTTSKAVYIGFIVCGCIVIVAGNILYLRYKRNKEEACIWMSEKGKYYLILVGIISLVFIALYGKYIWGNDVYAFSDIGSDTFYGYLPFYENYLQKIKSLDIGFFSLEYGIGTSGLAGSSQCLDIPFIFVLLLFKETKIYQGLLFVTYIKYLFIAIVAMKYFVLRKYQYKTAMIAAVIWAFCSWSVLWGQHYWLLSGICYFTFLLYLLELFLTKKKKYAIIFILTLGIYCSVNLYFAYSICASLGVYLLISRIITKEGIRNILKDVFMYLGAVIIALLIFFPFVYIQMQLVLDSARGTSLSDIKLFEFSFRKVIVILGRFFSADIFGIENYGGANNLYEDPILATSMLATPAIVTIVRQKQKRKWVLLGLCGIIMFVPIINYVFIMINTPRWYYFISFIEVICIVKLLDTIAIKGKVIDGKDVTVLSFFYAIAIVLLFVADLIGVVNIDWISFLGRMIIASCMIYVLHADKLIYNKKLVVITVLVILEIILGNYNIVCNRKSIDGQTIEAYIESEQKELVDYIKEVDDSLYRINVYDRSSMLSDAALNGYNGLNSYCSVNSKAYLMFLDRLDERDSAHGMSKEANHVDISKSNYPLQTMLGTKYIISSEGAPIGYKLIKEINGVGLYLNENYVKMGYAYSSFISIDEYEDLSLAEKSLILFESCYVDKDGENFGLEQNSAHKAEIMEADVLERAFNSKKGVISGLCGNKQEYVMIELDNENVARTGTYDISFDLDVSITGLYAKIVAGNSKDGIICEEYRYLTSGNKRYNVLLDTSKDVDYINIIPVYVEKTDNGEYEFSLKNIVIKKWNNFYEDEYLLATKALQNRMASEVEYRDNTILAKYNNQGKETQVFCIPVGYSTFWKAEINGVEKEVFAVNDAFCGVYVEPGENTIILVYDGVTDVTLYMSILGILILICASISILGEEKKRRVIKQ